MLVLTIRRWKTICRRSPSTSCTTTTARFTNVPRASRGGAHSEPSLFKLPALEFLHQDPGTMGQLRRPDGYAHGHDAQHAVPDVGEHGQVGIAAFLDSFI